MKKFFIFFVYLLSSACFASTLNHSQDISAIALSAAPSSCPHAPPTTDPTFCASFKSIANCHCLQHGGVSPAACGDMSRLYAIMISVYGWPGACSPLAQQDTTQQECVDDWNYYRSQCH